LIQQFDVRGVNQDWIAFLFFSFLFEVAMNAKCKLKFVPFLYSVGIPGNYNISLRGRACHAT
jgi:hypothetical protein